MKYKVQFYKGGRVIAAGTVTAQSVDEAINQAEFTMICHFSNIEYDAVKAQRED